MRFQEAVSNSNNKNRMRQSNDSLARSMQAFVRMQARIHAHRALKSRGQPIQLPKSLCYTMEPRTSDAEVSMRKPNPPCECLFEVFSLGIMKSAPVDLHFVMPYISWNRVLRRHVGDGYEMATHIIFLEQSNNKCVTMI